MPAARIQPQGRVQLNLRNPLTRGLQIALDFAQPRQLLGGGKTSIATSTMARGVSPQGITGNASAASGYTSFSASSIFAQGAWTSLSLVSFPAIGNCAISVVADTPGSATNDRSVYLNATGYLTSYIFDAPGGNTQRYATDTTLMLANTPYLVGASCTGAALETWKNGVKVASVATTNGGYDYGGTPPVHVLGYDPLSGSHGSNTSNARFSLHLFWSRALTAAEHASIAANPWQLFEGQPAMLSAPVASAGSGATASPAGVSAASAVGSATATGQAKASPAGVSAAASVGAATVSGQGKASPAGVLAASAVGAATGSGAASSTAQPVGVGAAASVGAAIATGQAKAAPSGVSASAAAGTATATGQAITTAYPAGVQAAATVGSATARGTATAAPLGVSSSIYVGTAYAYGPFDISSYPKLYATTLMRLDTVSRQGGTLNDAFAAQSAIRATEAQSTLMRAAAINLTSAMRSDPINRTAGLL